MALDRPATTERRFVANQHKRFALNFIVIVNSLFVKHFFYVNNEDKIALFLPMFLDVENGHFQFCCREHNKIPTKSGFLVAVWDVEISGTDNHCLVEILSLNLKSWHNRKVIFPMRGIFTAAVAKRLNTHPFCLQHLVFLHFLYFQRP